MCHNETTTVSVSSRAGVDGAPGHAITLCNERTSASADRSLGQARAGVLRAQETTLPAQRFQLAAKSRCISAPRRHPRLVLDGHALVDKRTDRTRAPRSSLTSIGSGLGHSQTSAVSRTDEVPIWLLRGLPAVTRLREQANTPTVLHAPGARNLEPPLRPAPATSAAVASLPQVVPGPGPDRFMSPELVATGELVSW